MKQAALIASRVQPRLRKAFLVASRFLVRRHRELLLGAAWCLAAAGLPGRPDPRYLYLAVYASLLSVPALTLALTLWPLRKKDPLPAGPLFQAGLAGSLLLALLVQRTGGLDSPLLPGYFVILGAAAFAHDKLRVAGGLTASVLLLETSALLAATAGRPGTAPALYLLGFAVALAAATGVIGWYSHRRWHETAGVRRELELLKTEARSLGALGGEGADSAAGSLSQEARNSTRVGATMRMDEKLAPLLDLAVHSLEADACGLYLLDEGGEGIHLKLVRPKPTGPAPATRLPLAGEILGSVIRSGAPLVIGRLDAAGGRGSYLSPGGRPCSLAAAPVMAPLGAVIGVLVAEAARPDAFPGKKELLAGFSGQVAEVFLTSHQVLRTEEEGRKQDAMFQVSNALARCLKERDIVRTLLDETAAVMGHRLGAFFAVGEGGEVTLRTSRGLAPEENGRTFNVSKCLLGHVVAHGKPFIFGDLHDGKRQIPVVTGLAIPCRSLLAVPLITDERITGILLAADPEPGRFEQLHLDILRLLANQAAVQLTNAALHERMEQMAITDGLTGLFNHRHFHERLAEELVRVKRHPEALSVIILDIDHFKKVNDTYGHPFGDVVLKGVSRLLTTLAREADLVARYGGEEMALMLVNTNRRGAETMATRVLKGMRALRFPCRDVEVRVTASLGSSTYPDDAAGASELVRAADEALYRSKHEGRDRYTPSGVREGVKG